MRLHRNATILITSVMTATALAAVLPVATPELNHGTVSHAVNSTVVVVDSGTTPQTLDTHHDF